MLGAVLRWFLVCCVCSAAKQLAGNYGFDPLYLAAKDEDSFKW